MSYHTIAVRDWQDLTEVFDALEVYKNPLGWYWRGQADAGWRLEPSILRMFHQQAPSVEEALGLERVALTLFQSQAHLYFKPDIIDRNSWSCIAWWTLMQHYSCPTRLLDWTRSPYVAAYFAVSQHCHADGAIWFFSAPALEQVMEKRYGRLNYDRPGEFADHEQRSAIYPVPGFQHTQRSAAQQGVFTVSTCILANHGDAISQALDRRPATEQLTKVIIPAQSKLPMLAQLHTMNITAKTLFAGIDGVGRSVCETLGLTIWRNRKH